MLDSLEDLERERAAGDLSDADYGALRDRYTQRAAEVLRAIERASMADLEQAPGINAETARKVYDFLHGSPR